MKIAMYLRKSRAEEGEDTEQVLARHRALLTDYAKKYRMPLAENDIYEEVVSGDSLFARPQMQRLLHAVEEGSYTGLLCVDIDRLGRGNMREQGLILETLKDADCKIITPEKTYDLNDDLDETQTEFKTFFARQELKMIKKRLHRGLQATIEKGGHVGEPPYGYRRAYAGKTPTLEPVPEEAAIVQMVFQMYLDGTGCNGIAEKLKNMGVRSHRGDYFAVSSIRHMLDNPIYTGKIVWNRTHWERPKHNGERIRTRDIPPDQWVTRDGLHPAIIDQQTYDKVQAIRRAHSRPPYHAPDQLENPLSGLLYCRGCGHCMTRRPYPASRKYQHAMMICTTKGCMRGSRLDYVEQAVYAALQDEYKSLKIRLTSPVIQQEAKVSQDIITGLKQEMSKLIHQKARLYDLLEQEVYTVEVFAQREQDLIGRIRAVDAQIKTEEQRRDGREETIRRQLPRISCILQNYWSGAPAERNKLLKTVIQKIDYYKPKDAAPFGFQLEIKYHENYI